MDVMGNGLEVVGAAWLASLVVALAMRGLWGLLDLRAARLAPDEASDAPSAAPAPASSSPSSVPSPSPSSVPSPSHATGAPVTA